MIFPAAKGLSNYETDCIFGAMFLYMTLDKDIIQKNSVYDADLGSYTENVRISPRRGRLYGKFPYNT